MLHPAEVDEVSADGHDEGAASPATANVDATAVGQFAEPRIEPRPRLLFALGLVVTLAGFCLAVLSLASAVLIPLMYSDTQEKYPIQLDNHNLYAYGVWLAFLMVACGTLALRTAHDQTVKSFVRFYSVAWLAALACLGVTVARVVYYATGAYRGAVAADSPHKRAQFLVQVACDSLALGSLCLTAAAVPLHFQLARRHWPAATAEERRRPSDGVLRINEDERSSDGARLYS